MSEEPKQRANWIGVPQFFNLNNCCLILSDAFGTVPYLVGSCLQKRDYRDVDVRIILADEHYDRLFPGHGSLSQRNALWSIMCASISEWLALRTGLPIDFQIQRQTEANKDFPGPRHALGVYHYKEPGK